VRRFRERAAIVFARRVEVSEHHDLVPRLDGVEHDRRELAELLFAHVRVGAARFQVNDEDSERRPVIRAAQAHLERGLSVLSELRLLVRARIREHEALAVVEDADALQRTAVVGTGRPGVAETLARRHLERADR
jgi:hypothetical protein